MGKTTVPMSAFTTDTGSLARQPCSLHYTSTTDIGEQESARQRGFCHPALETDQCEPSNRAASCKPTLKQVFRNLHARRSFHCEGVSGPVAASYEHIVLDRQVLGAGRLLRGRRAAASDCLVVPVVLDQNVVHRAQTAPLQVKPHWSADDDIVMGVEVTCASMISLYAAATTAYCVLRRNKCMVMQVPDLASW